MQGIKLSVLAIAAALATGCATNDYSAMSQGSGLQAVSLSTNCKEITCSYDKLKDRVQASASDMNVLFALNGVESRTIQFTWVSGSKDISVDLYSVALYGTWSIIDSAEIYVGKEAVAKISGGADRTVGTYNKVAKELEKIEVIHGKLSFEQAEKIAGAEYKNVTIRFYGKNGYKDAPLPRSHKLINVVNLAKSA